MALNTYIASHVQQDEELSALREWETTLAVSSIREKACHCIRVFAGHPIVPLSLVTKETRGLIDRLMDSARERVFHVHRLIVVVYVPVVLKDALGSISIKLFHADTNQSIDVVVGHLVSKSAVFVARWPRAVHSKSTGLSLLVNIDDHSTKRGGLVGVLHPYWEDKASTKMVYEKQLPSLSYLLEEQDPAYYVSKPEKLRPFLADKIMLGGQGSDMAPQTMSLHAPSSKPMKKYVPPPLRST